MEDKEKLINYCQCGCNAIIPFKEYHKWHKPKYLIEHKFSYKQTKIKIKCKTCGIIKEYRPIDTKGRKYCSKNCYWSDINKLHGKKHWNWKGGKRGINKNIRNSIKYNDWRQKVFERDLYTCQLCNISGIYLEAHHKIPLSVLININNIKTIEDAYQCKSIWKLKNGITLCESCHIKIDKNKKRFAIK